MSNGSRIWEQTKKKVLICKNCVNNLWQEISEEYNSETTALKICCHYLDIPYWEDIYQNVVEKNKVFSIGTYVSRINMQQYGKKSFLDSIVSGDLNRTKDDIKEYRESKWSKNDKKNMDYAIDIVGYDPFDDISLTDSDRKQGFNILSLYCESDDVKDDSHKLLCVIQMVQDLLQCRKIDDYINQECLKEVPDPGRIKSLTSAKKQLSDSIAKSAKDNNIASAYNGVSKKGNHTLSMKLKEMSDNKFQPSQVDLFDIKTSDSMRQIADISNKSILSQLNLSENEYTEMISEQREMILGLQNENGEMQEELRQLKNKLCLLEQNGG